MCDNGFMQNPVATQLETALAVLAAVPTDEAIYTSLADADLLTVAKLAGDVRHAVATHAALASAEVVRRSAPELGHSGLAQAAGFRTPVELLRTTARVSAREATQSVSVGRLARGDDPREWLQPVGQAVRESELSVAAAESIASGLGLLSAGVSADELGAAATQLCEEAATLDPDRLFERAREVRAGLDLAGVADREEALRQQRALRLYRRPNGMSRLTWDIAPEDAATVKDIYDRATSPKLGGVRFVDKENAALADRIFDDPRTTEQLASDVFAELLRQGSAADSSELLGTGAPSIQVVVLDEHLRARVGQAFIDGQSEPVSIETVERLSCGGHVALIKFDDKGQPLDLGREQRLFSRFQRKALAARDGGCRFGNCGRPASWTEAHHIKHWKRDHGETNIRDGILLCRHHHMLVHNNHWEIVRDADDQYWLIPPREVDPDQVPRRMHSKSRALKAVMAAVRVAS